MNNYNELFNDNTKEGFKFNYKGLDFSKPVKIDSSDSVFVKTISNNDIFGKSPDDIDKEEPTVIYRCACGHLTGRYNYYNYINNGYVCECCNTKPKAITVGKKEPDKFKVNIPLRITQGEFETFYYQLTDKINFVIWISEEDGISTVYLSVTHANIGTIKINEFKVEDTAENIIKGYNTKITKDGRGIMFYYYGNNVCLLNTSDTKFVIMAGNTYKPTYRDMIFDVELNYEELWLDVDDNRNINTTETDVRKFPSMKNLCEQRRKLQNELYDGDIF